MSNLAEKQSIGAHPFIYPEPVVLVGSYDVNGKPNMMLVAWAGICSSNPPSLMIAVRPNRWTHEGVLQHKAFTVGMVTEDMLVKADYAGLASGKKEDKFGVTGYTPVRAEKVDAPYVAECPVILECALTDSRTVGVHTIMFGDILDIKADKNCLGENGKPDITKVRPLVYEMGANAYYGIGSRLGNAFADGKVLLRSGQE